MDSIRGGKQMAEPLILDKAIKCKNCGLIEEYNEEPSEGWSDDLCPDCRGEVIE